MRLPTVVLVALVFVSSIALLPHGSRAAESASVSILFDLGDGSYDWSRVTTADRFAENASWQATLDGAGQHGLSVSYRWFPGLGIAVSDIGDRRGPSGFAGLFVWNDSGAWEASSVGISALILADGDAIAWSNAAYDSVDFGLRTPVPTPAYPYPAMGFRADGLAGRASGLQAAGTGTSASDAPNGAGVLWDRDLQTREIVSSPAVAYGLAYAETFDGLYALDDATGEVRWHDPAVKGFSSPAIFDGSVIVGSSSGRVYRLDARDGLEIWNTSLVSQPRFSGITSSPRVWMDWVYVGTFNETGGPGEVVSLWASNGTVAWRHPTGSIHYSSPAVMRGILYVGVMGAYNTTTNVTFDPPYGVVSLYASNGSERWFFPTGGPVAASPLVTGSLVIVPSKDGNLYAISLADGTERWRAAVGAGVSSPALFGDTVFVGGGSLLGPGRVTAVNRTTGVVGWSVVPNGPVQASLSYADGKVFFATNAAEGRIYALDASSGTVAWWYAPDPAEYVLASPVVSNGTLYAPSDNGHLYAFRDSPAQRLAVVSMEAPVAPLLVGDEADAVVTVRALRGALRDVRLQVSHTSEVEVVAATPSPSQPPSTWDLGAVAFQENRTVTVRIRALHPSQAATGAEVAAVVVYSAVDGSPSSAAGSATLTVTDRGLPPYVTYLAVAAVAGSVLAILALLLWRRRRAPG
ncbi:MAG: hypothetical protein E6K10_09960 [Methanobacteriota archaeon]|nr:MAG: hypothetical protein E6K10_09960 [Euryarchaeota archaeon]